MEDQTRNLGGTTGPGATAHTPPFGATGPAVDTADHQIPSSTASASGAGAESMGAGGMGGSQGAEPQGRAEQIKERANQGMKQAADRLDTAAQRIDRMADERLGGGGNRARAGEMAHSAADTMESVAGYLRNNDVQGLQRDLERQVRERPLQTLLIGVAAGWIVGKILR